MFWRDKKKFHNPVILFLRFVFLFWAVPFSFFLEFQLFFSFLTFFFGEGVFLGSCCCCCSGGRKMIFFIIHKQIFQDFSIFLYIFLILYRHLFCKTTNKKSKLYSKIKPRKKAVNIKKKELKTKKTGPGLCPDTLRNCCDLSYSNNKNLDIDGNFEIKHKFCEWFSRKSR
jgi:predicted membrane protein